MLLATLLLSAGSLTLPAPAAAQQQPVPGSAAVLDGPSSDIVRPSGLGLSIARDGSGGLVYLKQVGGIPHVFVSPLVSGAFQPPVQVDGGLPDNSSAPVIAAGNGGVLLIGFINDGELYVVDRPSASSPFGAPIGLAGAASNPAISMTNLGKAYLAFTVADGGGHDVRTAYYVGGTWSLEGPPLNAVPADSAGTGSGRPAVAAAGDGVAIVVWGEAGHVYSRRVWGTSPSVVYEQADAPPSGCTEASADEPVVGAGGDSSYAAVAFREFVTCGGHQQSRVLSNRLHASIYDGISNADGLSGAPADGATDPQVTATEYGQGWVTSERTASNGVFAEMLDQTTLPAGVGQVNSLPAAAAPYPVPATAGLYSTLIAWQQQPGSSGPAEIRVRYAPDGVTLGPETVVSSPAQGPVDAADGLTAAGDADGDAAIAWLQGTAGAAAVMVEQMYQPPGAFSVTGPAHYVKSAQPGFSWTAPRGWGPIRYSLSIDGRPALQTYANAASVPTPLPDGPHSWQVVATNPAGQSSQTHPVPVFIDTVPPRARLKLRGRRVAGFTLQANLAYRDLPPAGEPRRDASGVVKVVIHWGDGTTLRLKVGLHRAEHVYRRAGHYRVVVLVTDRAGNVTRLIAKVRIAGSVAALPKPSHGKPKTGSRTGGASKP